MKIKNGLNHYGHVYTSINELEKIFKRDYDILTLRHDIEKNIITRDYASFEIVSNKYYWFRVQKPINEIKDNNKKYYFSIYGESISCLALFEMHTRLKAITVNEFINNISSPYKVFKK